MKILFKYSILIVVLIAYLAGLAIQPDFEERRIYEQKTFFGRSTESFSLSASLIEDESSYLSRFLPFLNYPSTPTATVSSTARDFVQPLFAKELNDLSYKGIKIQILSARSHPPTPALLIV